MKKIVILGAGYAGILAAKKLEKKIRKRDDIQITLIDKNPFHTMLTELHEVAACRVEEESIRISLQKVFAERKVEVVQDTIKNIDFSKKEVEGEHSRYAYDYVVLASGSRPAFYGVAGAEEHSFTLWSYDDAIKLRNHIEDCFIKAATEPNEAKKRELLTFAVVGSGFTGVEMAGELAEYVPILCERFELESSLVTVINADVLDRVCMALPARLSAKIQKRLEKMGVRVLTNTQITAVGANSIDMRTTDKTEHIITHTVIWVAGVQGSTVAAGAKSIGEGKGGRIATNDYLQAINDSSVYVAGDNIFYTPEGEKMPVPSMVENAEHSADTVAHNLLVDVTGSGEKEQYRPKFHGMMVCLGGRYGVAYGGLPGKFMGMPSFMSMFAKHFINITYFAQVLGWNKIFSYLKHEFFTIRNKRSFVGGYFSNRSASFMLVPLRLFLGGFWIYEGLVKLSEGWLDSPKLSGFIGSAANWWDNLIAANAPLMQEAVPDNWDDFFDEVTVVATEDWSDFFTAPVETVVDTVTSASEQAGDVVSNLVINWDFFGLVQWLLVTGSNIATKIRIPLMDSMLMGMISNDTLSMVMQTMIVLLEIGVGLALIGGLLTTVVAAVSLGLQLMFLTSTGLYLETWWMLPASFAMMFGAGSVFSLDYYVMPCLKQCWKKTKLARKWYWYND